MNSFRYFFYCLSILGLASLISPFNLPGQVSLGGNNDKQDFPYSLKASKDLVILPVSTGLLVAGLVGNELHQAMTGTEILALNRSSLLPIDSRVIYNWNPKLNNIRETFEPASFIAGLGIIGIISRQHIIQEKNYNPAITLLTMYAEGAFLSEGMVLLSKVSISRPRPFTYNSNLSLDYRVRSSANNESFFSGNATVLFYNATFISQVLTDIYPGKPWLPYVWAGSHAIASLSGYWSVKSGMHFPTDVIAGAIWGSSMALIVTMVHKKKNKRVKIIPWASNIGQGATLQLSLEP
ncbi:MAG: phosphatase PAP2 family protein [Bacteroidales bacterium]|nr:phosphatase PAP2 family protein [Bacteroidales bacterium]